MRIVKEKILAFCDRKFFSMDSEKDQIIPLLFSIFPCCQENSEMSNGEMSLKKFTLAEVAKHKDPKDCAARAALAARATHAACAAAALEEEESYGAGKSGPTFVNPIYSKNKLILPNLNYPAIRLPWISIPV